MAVVALSVLTVACADAQGRLHGRRPTGLRALVGSQLYELDLGENPERQPDE